MDTSGLHRHLPSQGTARSRELIAKMLRGKTIEGSLNESAVEQLATIPQPWLEKFADENVAFAALAFGETLADTELLRDSTPDVLLREAARARDFRTQAEAGVSKEIEELSASDPMQAAFAEHSRPQLLAEKLGATLAGEGLGFQVRVMRDSMPLEYLQNEFGISDEDHEYLYPEGGHDEQRETAIFRSLLVDLNGEGVLTGDGIVDPSNDVLIVPYKMSKGRRVSPVLEEGLKSVTGQQMDNNLGMHVWPNRLIVVDDDVLAMPSVKTGFHSVLLHESGHGIDYMAESIPELNHRETMDNFYKEAMQEYKSGNNTFLTPRAMDNEREYFAEAVEAYLTTELGKKPGNAYKPENNHEQMKAKNPELFAYVDKVMRWSGSAV